MRSKRGKRVFFSSAPPIFRWDAERRCISAGDPGRIWDRLNLGTDMRLRLDRRCPLCDHMGQ